MKNDDVSDVIRINLLERLLARKEELYKSASEMSDLRGAKVLELKGILTHTRSFLETALKADNLESMKAQIQFLTQELKDV